MDEAIAEYRTAHPLKPDSAEAHNNLGTPWAQGKPDEAIAEYRTAIRLKPDYAEAHYNLGNALKHQGKVDEAIAEYRAAIRLKPDYAEAHCNLGRSSYEQGDYAGGAGDATQGPRAGLAQADWRVSLGGVGRTGRATAGPLTRFRPSFEGRTSPRKQRAR